MAFGRIRSSYARLLFWSWIGRMAFIRSVGLLCRFYGKRHEFEWDLKDTDQVNQKPSCVAHRILVTEDKDPSIYT